ncbi:hypothetical protein [Teichococcus rhizosphaerae]|nr:hypothetical protein [Pseudoroseomonas rhizosphaerae]
MAAGSEGSEGGCGVAVEHADWVAGELSVQGPAAEAARLAGAAAGAGVIPWRLDHAAMEEDLFHRLAARYPRTGRLSLEGCRAFAAQFREKVEDRHRRALAAVGVSRACCLDLHALLPVPPEVLALGPAHPAARRWLRAHWGTTELRRVVRLPAGRGGRRPPGEALLRFGFFAAGALPFAAVRRLERQWPALRLALRPAGGAG